jgi:hypothetical protein
VGFTLLILISLPMPILLPVHHLRDMHTCPETTWLAIIAMTSISNLTLRNRVNQRMKARMTRMMKKIWRHERPGIMKASLRRSPKSMVNCHFCQLKQMLPQDLTQQIIQWIMYPQWSLIIHLPLILYLVSHISVYIDALNLTPQALCTPSLWSNLASELCLKFQAPQTSCCLHQISQENYRASVISEMRIGGFVSRINHCKLN